MINIFSENGIEFSGAFAEVLGQVIRSPEGYFSYVQGDSTKLGRSMIVGDLTKYIGMCSAG